MDVGKSFTYMFEDKDWLKKIAIGGGILLLGGLILGVLVIPAIAACLVRLESGHSAQSRVRQYAP